MRRFQGRVYSIAYHYLRDAEEARDAAQMVFMRLYERLSTLKESETFLPWMIRLARNCCIDHLRRRRVRTPTYSVPLDEATELPAEGPTPDVDVDERARRRLVYRALETVGEPMRELILLKEIHGLKLEEIARLLDEPLGTVKSRSHRARIELARAVRTLDPSFGERP